MKLILEKEDGIKVEIREINTLEKGSNILFFFLNTHLRKEDIEAIETELINKIGKRCVVLDSIFVNKIMGI